MVRFAMEILSDSGSVPGGQVFFCIFLFFFPFFPSFPPLFSRLFVFFLAQPARIYHLRCQHALRYKLGMLGTRYLSTEKTPTYDTYDIFLTFYFFAVSFSSFPPRLFVFFLAQPARIYPLRCHYPQYSAIYMGACITGAHTLLSLHTCLSHT